MSCKKASESIRKKVVGVLGTFDGVHKGHASLLQKAKAAAQTGKLPLVVFTFSPNPKELLSPQSFKGALVNDEREKNHLLKDQGANDVLVIPFTEDLASRSPEDFIDNILLRDFDFKEFFVGENFTFGAGGKGTPATLRAAIPNLKVVELLKMSGRPVSSTSIREALLQGDIESANEMLGRPYELSGIVEKGKGRGRKLHFPTANFVPPAKKVLPAAGVYAGFAQTQKGKRYMAAINVGTSPTFTDEVKPYVEVHLLDFDGDLYGKKMTVFFVVRLREEKSFLSVQELADAVQSDVKEVRELLADLLFANGPQGASGRKEGRRVDF